METGGTTPRVTACFPVRLFMSCKVAFCEDENNFFIAHQKGLDRIGTQPTPLLRPFMAKHYRRATERSLLDSLAYRGLVSQSDIEAALKESLSHEVELETILDRKSVV